MIELDPLNSVFGSFNFCCRAVRLANETGERVHTTLWGRDVYADPGDKADELYRLWAPEYDGDRE
jgi:hypothetical protein